MPKRSFENEISRPNNPFDNYTILATELMWVPLKWNNKEASALKREWLKEIYVKSEWRNQEENGHEISVCSVSVYG